MKPGDIFLVMTHNFWLSKAIAKVMGSEWSHSGLIYDVSGREPYTFETTSLETTVQFFNDYVNNPNISYEVWSPIEATDEQRLQICEDAKKTNETPYGIMQFISLGLRRLLMRVGIKMPNFIRQGQVCCHVVFKGYNKKGFGEISEVDPESKDTEELKQMIYAGKFKLVRKCTRGVEAPSPT